MATQSMPCSPHSHSREYNEVLGLSESPRMTDNGGSETFGNYRQWGMTDNGWDEIHMETIDNLHSGTGPDNGK